MNDASWYKKPILVDHFPIALKPEACLSLFVTVLSRMEPKEQNEFILNLLRRADAAGVEIAGCAADGIVAMEGWK